MGHIGRLFVIFAGLVCGVAGGVIALPVLALMDPVTREAGFVMFTTGILALIDNAIEPDGVAASLLLLLHGVALAICVAPLGVAALLGELARVRSWFWYACCSGGLAAAMPFLLRLWMGLERRTAAPDSTIAVTESRFLLLFFFVGLVAGTIYWLIAGRNAGAASTELEGTAT
jgi:hypothetical protein